jgi:hypothetical protein
MTVIHALDEQQTTAMLRELLEFPAAEARRVASGKSRTRGEAAFGLSLARSPVITEAERAESTPPRQRTAWAARSEGAAGLGGVAR